MIFRVDPENGHDLGLLLARGAAGQLDRSQCFEERKEWSSERPGLLAGEDGDRLRVGECLCGLPRGRRSAATFLLGCDDPDNLRVLAWHRPRSADGVGPRLSRRRVASVERGDLGKFECVVAGERPDPVEAPHVDRSAGRAVDEGRIRCHRFVLSQSAVKHVKATITRLRRM